MIDRLVCMAHIGALQLDETTDSEDACAISYLADDTKRVLRDLPLFTSIDSWSKKTKRVYLYEFVDLLSLWEGQNI